MFKRVTIVALVVAAFLVLAVPAMAFNGYRADYTTSYACATCHSGIAGIPAVYPEWKETKHGEGEAYLDVYNRLPYGSVCQGCHTSNFDPSKLTPVPTATAANGTVSWAAAPAPTATGTDFPQITQSTGDLAWSESSIGCSSCHYGANTAGAGLEPYGSDSNDTAHMVPYGDMANADICGACHSRYSYTVATYSVTPVPYLKVTSTPTPGTPVTPNPSATTLIQPQMAIGYPMLGSPSPAPATGWDPAAPLSQYLTVQHPGWTPSPNPSATTGGYGKLMTYWQLDNAPVNGAAGISGGTDTTWQNTGHDGSAAQYPEWASDGLAFGHAKALTALTSQSFWAFLPETSKQECLECHSADFRILKEAGKNPTSADVKYGITCVGCHAPHDAGTVAGVWDKNFDAQLVNDDQLNGNGSNLCTECHNGEIPAGSTASPGAEVHHPMKEMMDGYGAIDVAAFPSVHKGKCIQCHMPPTSYSRGSVQLGGNHTFNIITPKVATEVTPIAVSTTTATATQLPIPGTTNLPVVTTTVTTAYSRMPYSACSTCHDNNPKGETVTTASTATATPTALPTTVQVTVTRSTMVASGDKAMWLQDTIDQRQEWTTEKIAHIHDLLDQAAVRLGYADEAAAQAALVAKAEADRTTAETSFLKAFTNVGYVESEGSFGIHNWDYSRQIVNTAIWEAESVQAQPAPAPWSITFKASKTSVKHGTKVTYSGTIAPADALAFGHATVTLQRSQNGTWSKWKTVVCKADGSYSLGVTMNNKGTFKLRALMPAYNAHNMTQGNSGSVTVKVK